MNRCQFLLGLGVLLVPALIHAQSPMPIQHAQIEALGLHFEDPMPATAAPGPYWPGVAAMPPEEHELLIAPLPGRVVRVHAAAGDVVRAGQPLLTLHSTALIQLIQEHRQAQANESLARHTLTRERRLLSEGIGVERRVREAEIAVHQAKAATDGLRARLESAGRPDTDAKGSISSIILKAPRDGHLLKIDMQPGAWLDEGAPALELGYGVARRIEVEVPVEEAARIMPGQLARIERHDVEGRVLATGLTVDPLRQTVSIRVGVEQGASLRPGQRLRLRFEQPGRLWRVPRAALVGIDGQTGLFVLRQDGLHWVVSAAHGVEGNHDLVDAALQPGDRIVSQGAAVLKSAWQSRTMGEAKP